MSKSGSGKNGQSKRLARAKVKPAETKAKGKPADGKAGKKAAKRSAAQAKADRKKRFTTIIIVVFAIIMALSMMLPSLSSIFTSTDSTSSTSEEQDASTSDTSSSDSSSSTTSTMDSIDQQYESTVSSLEKELEDDPENLATLLNLGNDYMSWGYTASQYASTDDENAHVDELLDKAISYYDQYLELNDSDVVKVDRALCTYYKGDVDEAQAELEQITTDSPDCAIAWANLGMVYESNGADYSAKKAYEKAEETDPDDEYGAKSYAEERLDALQSEANSTTTTSTTSDSSSEGLSDALGGLSGN